MVLLMLMMPMRLGPLVRDANQGRRREAPAVSPLRARASTARTIAIQPRFRERADGGVQQMKGTKNTFHGMPHPHTVGQNYHDNVHVTLMDIGRNPSDMYA